MHDAINLSGQSFEGLSFLIKILMTVIDAPNSTDYMPKTTFGMITWNSCPRQQ